MWKAEIERQYSYYIKRQQDKAAYLTNIVTFFCGNNQQYYPVKGGAVQPSDLTPAELNKYEFYEFDIRKMQFEVLIQYNMVLSTRVPRDWPSVKDSINAIKVNPIYSRSPSFDSYPPEEQAIWNACQIPVRGTGTVSNPNNHPLYNRLCDIYNHPSSKALRDAGNWEKYYKDFCFNGVGVASAFMANDWNKKFLSLTATQLKGFELPTDDFRRLQIECVRAEYRNGLILRPTGLDPSAQDYARYKINVLFDDLKNLHSPPLTDAEKARYIFLPTCAYGTGGRRRRTRRRKGRASKNQKRKRSRHR